MVGSLAFVAIAAWSASLHWYAQEAPQQQEEAEVPRENEIEKRTDVSLEDATIRVDIVDTPELRARGLSGRELLADDEGMLFVFPEEAAHSFWMKDMLIPIDIVWLSADKKVVHIVEAATPASYPAVFAPPTSARYVLEVSALWARRHGVGLGSIATF